jgi:hypothetical protein
LMRDGARPPLALDRLRRLPGGRLAYRVSRQGASRRARQVSRDDAAGVPRPPRGARAAPALPVAQIPWCSRASLRLEARRGPTRSRDEGGSRIARDDQGRTSTAARAAKRRTGSARTRLSWP